LRLTKGWFRKKKKEEARRGQANGEAAAVWQSVCFAGLL
jgi:hypothetical protein